MWRWLASLVLGAGCNANADVALQAFDGAPSTELVDGFFVGPLEGSEGDGYYSLIATSYDNACGRYLELADQILQVVDAGHSLEAMEAYAAWYSGAFPSEHWVLGMRWKPRDADVEGTYVPSFAAAQLDDQSFHAVLHHTDGWIFVDPNAYGGPRLRLTEASTWWSVEEGGQLTVTRARENEMKGVVQGPLQNAVRTSPPSGEIEVAFRVGYCAGIEHHLTEMPQLNP